MTPDGKLERWNDPLVMGDSELPDGMRGNATIPHFREVSVDQFAGMVEETLGTFQSYHVPHSTDPWTINFPFAWELAEGVPVYNETTRDHYTISGVFRDPSTNLPNGWVVLTGGNPPKVSDRLLIDKAHRLRFHHGYPKSLQPYFLVDQSDTSGQHTGAWFETITWTVVKSEPGTVSGAPLGGPRQRKVRFANLYIDQQDEGYAIEVYGQPFESIIAFDLWAQTEEAASRLVSWFKAFMSLNTRVFKFNGVRELMFWDRRADNVSAQFRKDIVSRTLTWMARTEELFTSTDRLISRLQYIFQVEGVEPTGTLGILDPTGVPLIEVTESS